MTIRELLKDLKFSSPNIQVLLKDSIYISNKEKDDIDDDILCKEIGYWSPEVHLEEGSLSWVIYIAAKEWCILMGNKEEHSNDC